MGDDAARAPAVPVLTETSDATPTEREQRAYDALFPTYVEICAVTQSHRRGAKPGGWGGHATMFACGVERDADAPYPRLLIARAADSDASAGVGISVNRIFRNVNWVAIPGRDMFFRGGLAPDATLDERFYDRAVAVAASSGWFAGIRIDERVMRERGSSTTFEEFVVRHSIATDFALTFARHVYSARLPLPRDALARVVDYLNAANERAHASGYTWNAYTDNCSHVLHNALAAAGVWDPKTARASGILNLARDVASVARAVATGRTSDFSFPANNFVRTYEAGNRRPIDDVVAAFHNRDIVRTLSAGWISTGPGALIARYPMHDGARNELFLSGRDPFLFSVPTVWDKRHEFLELTRAASPVLTNLGANLAHFRDRYDRALAQRSSGHGVGAGASFASFAERFHSYIAQQRTLIDEQIAAYRDWSVA